MNYESHRIYSTYKGESAIPDQKILLTDLEKHLVVSKNNGSESKYEDNIFVIQGKDKINYEGNIKEKFIEQKNYELTATLTVTANKEDWGGWKEGESGAATVVKTGANKNDFNLKFDNGAGLFNITGLNGNKSIITYVELIAEDGTVIKGKKGNATGNGEDIYADTPEGYRIGFHDNHFYVTKDGYLTEDKTYTVVAYHQDVVMGKIKLTLKEGITDIGEATVVMDIRLNQGELPDYNWVYPDGVIKYGMEEKNIPYYYEYPKLVKKRVSFKNLSDVKIIKAIAVEDRPVIPNLSERYIDHKGRQYRYFLRANFGYRDEVMIPFNFTLSNIEDHILVSKYNALRNPFLDNKFTVHGENGKLYKGNFKQEYVGEQNQTGKAILEIPGEAGTEGKWKVGDTGKVEGITDDKKTESYEKDDKIKYVLNFTSGKMFDFLAKEIGNTKTIVTSMKITEKEGDTISGGTITKNGNAGDRIEIATKYNIIAFEGENFIIKKLDYYDKDRVYLIEAYYNKVKLGELELTIPADKIELGEVEFVFDKRLVNLKIPTSQRWSFGNKTISQLTGDNQIVASEMISINAEKLKNIEDVIVRKIIKVEGKPVVKTLYNHKIFGVPYKEYQDGSSGNSSAFPLNINLQELTKYMTILMSNASSSVLSNDKFEILGYNGKLYKLNIKEKHLGDTNIIPIISEGIIDFRLADSRSAKWKPNSTGSSDNDKIKIEFTGGDKKVFDTRGIIDKKTASIADKLIIKDELGATLKTATLTNGKLRAELSTGEAFEIENDGTVIIQGRKEKGINTFKIEAHYSAVKLGEMTLTLKTGKSIRIEGNDTFNFGSMLQNRKYKLEGKILVKNEDALNITVDIPNSAKMTHTTDNSKEIPFTIDSTKNTVGNDVETRMILEAKTASDQHTGKYEGQFMITVTIND